jgi:hypothetical protein
MSQNMISKEMRQEKLLITPGMAKRCLAKNEQNRRINQQWVNFLAAEMEAGRFVTSPHGIVFDLEGKLIDGQHRLAAIVQSNLPQEMWVAQGFEREIVSKAIDRQKTRDLAAYARMIGCEEIHNSHGAIARILEYGPNPQGVMPNEKLLEITQKYWEGVRFAEEIGRGVHKMTAQILAVIARAYYSGDHERLRQFVEVYKTELAQSPGDHAAIALKKFARDKTKGNQASRRELYYKTEVAVRAFLKQRPLKILILPREELFPLPT